MPAEPNADLRSEVAALRRELEEQRRAVGQLRREVTGLREQLARAAPQDSDRRPAAPVQVVPDPASATAPADAAQPRLTAEGGAVYADQHSASQAKIALYRGLFTGRGDVYARRWENRVKAASGWSPAHRGNWRTP